MRVLPEIVLVVVFFVTIDGFWDWLTMMQNQIKMINNTDTAIHPILFVPIDVNMLLNKIKDIIYTKLIQFLNLEVLIFFNLLCIKLTSELDSS